MILEGIVTTVGANDEINVAPMGPIVDESMSRLILRPFQTSQTYQNLKHRPQGVFHVVDDVLMLAQAAIGHLAETPSTFAAERIGGVVLESACRWYEFEIVEFDDTDDRTRLVAEVVHSNRIRDYFGLNRAKHAVVEAAILATRVHLLPKQEILDQLVPLRVIVDKTCGPQELQAFELLEDYVQQFQTSP